MRAGRLVPRRCSRTAGLSTRLRRRLAGLWKSSRATSKSTEELVSRPHCSPQAWPLVLRSSKGLRHGHKPAATALMRLIPGFKGMNVGRLTIYARQTLPPRCVPPANAHCELVYVRVQILTHIRRTAGPKASTWKKWFAARRQKRAKGWRGEAKLYRRGRGCCGRGSAVAPSALVASRF